jgi:oleandomycin transport system ATP-binding protein
MTNAIQAEGLVKRFGATIALAGIDLEVGAGSVLGLLGPNGSGKTTAVRILATLIRPDEGRASIAGFDVTRQAHQVRQLIGLTGQYAALDENIRGDENLYLIGRLFGLSGKEARRRANELLERFSLTDAGRRNVKTYSGGMRRRLDIAASLIGRPQVLFLDEPTTGLDPSSRNELWEMVQGLVADGTTVLLCTQYLEEADHLANTIVVLDHGKVIARGTPDQLKQQVGGQVLEVRPIELAAIEQVSRIVSELAGTSAEVDLATHLVSAPVHDPGVLIEAVRRLDQAGIPVSELALRRASLDEVFLTLTGHRAVPDQPASTTERIAR